jgi:uncharacterized protein (TIGR03663 family)
MNRAAFAALFGAALVVALWFRLADPAARPMHHDEANQAIRFGLLLEDGDYRYDPQDHHGPTLYYMTLPFAWARGQFTLAALDERTLRMVPALFGAGLLLLFLTLAAAIGRPAAAAAAALAAVSVPLVYYSRFYIQESLFAFFALAFLVAAGRYALRPRTAAAYWAGVLGGLTFATKETSFIVLPVAGVASVLAMRLATDLPERRVLGARTLTRHALVAVAGAAIPVLLLYSAFFRHPAGVLDALGALPIYLSRGVEPGVHAHPWFYYLKTLAWSASGGVAWTEGLVLVLAAAGIVRAFVRREFWPLCLSVYAVATMAVFSAVAYKTPWNLLPFYSPLVLVAGVGAAALLDVAPSRAARAVVVLVLAAATWQLAAQSARANFRYPADERNPYVYAQTTRDYLRLAARVHDLTAVHPDGRDMLVAVVAAPHEQWPFPWYARDLPHVGYWVDAASATTLGAFPIIVASQEQAAAVDAAVGERYVSEYYGLRPGVLIALYVEAGLWERFMAARR